MAGEDLGIDTNLFLLDIFKKLIKHEDPEIALFAAESINAIENRYNKKIENLQELLSQIVDTESLRNLAQLLYELALINQSSITIKKFYLKEAYICYRNLENEDDLTPEDLLTPPVTRIQHVLSSLLLLAVVYLSLIEEIRDMILLYEPVEGCLCDRRA